MENLSFPTDENVLIGTGTADDAGVYKVSDELALIQTVDFFTPIVDDPFDFGRIAAANSLSDVYAMGGVPKTAMNIVAYPITTMGSEILKEMLAGGAEKVREAGAVLLGGHSVEDDELKYGLSITGFVHPDRILANRGLNEGDCLILTKPLGTGIINTAIKGGMASPETVRRITDIMATLNKTAAEVMEDFTVSACTDITGFGLIGHLAEMIQDSRTEVVLHPESIPVLEEAIEFGSMGLVPVGAHKNREYRKDMIRTTNELDPVLRDILFDPQTSGGLLIGCRESEADELQKRLRQEGVEQASIIGRVHAAETAQIRIL